MAPWIAPRIWEGGTAWIIGGGTSMPRQFDVPEDIIQAVMAGKQPASAYSPYLTPIHGKHVIGVNNVFKIGNWLDVLFFGDCAWYTVYRFPLAQYQPLKVTCCTRFANKPDKLCDGIRYLARNHQKLYGITEDPKQLSWNNNSGAAAINLAVNLGAKRIILLGFDMAVDGNNVSHWHGSHKPSGTNPRKIPPPPFARHLKGFPYIAADATRLGVEILNASPISTIAEFPKVAAKDFF